MKTIKFIYKDGRLIAHDRESYDEYKRILSLLKDGDVVEVAIDRWRKGSWAQLKKIHSTIRDISNTTGNTFNYIKDLVKHKAGLEDSEGEVISFKDCSVEELESVIHVLDELSEFTGVSQQSQ